MMFRIEDTPQYLIAYDKGHHDDITHYENLMRRWVERYERGERFGVILAMEEHDHDDEHNHDHDHDSERHAEYEAAFMKLLNDFRRDHKDHAADCTVGFARVAPQSFVDEYAQDNPDFIELMRVETDRMAQYMWGVPGNVFTTVEAAKQWLDDQFTQAPQTTKTAQAADVAAVTNTALFFGSSTGETEFVAFEIQKAWQEQGLEALPVENIGNVKDLSVLLNYDLLLLGIPTWNIGELQDDWDIAFPQLDSMDFSGKRVALFGIGDQYGYPENFLDAAGILANKLEERGAQLCGFWSTDGYEFELSIAQRGDQFVCLAIDDSNQSSETLSRIEKWVQQLIDELGLKSA